MLIIRYRKIILTVICFGAVLALFQFSFAGSISSYPAPPFILPLDGKISVGFREIYFNMTDGKYYRHTGIDIEGGSNSPVSASGNGIVAYKGISPIGGNTVVIRHNEMIRTTYLNLLEISVQTGRKVVRGQKIGTIGSYDDPSSAGTHLHFGVIYQDAYLNPEELLDIDYNNITDYIHLKYCPDDFRVYICPPEN